MYFNQPRLYLKQLLLHKYDDLDRCNLLKKPLSLKFVVKQNLPKNKNDILYHFLSLEWFLAQRTFNRTFGVHNTTNNLITTIRGINSFLFLDYCANSILLYNHFKRSKNKSCLTLNKNSNLVIKEYLSSPRFSQFYFFLTKTTIQTNK